MDRQYTLCVLVPAHQYRSYVDDYHHQPQNQQRRHQHQPPTYHQHQQQQLQRAAQQQYAREQIYENVVSQYRMRMCYHNDYENDEQIQRFYWEQCYNRDDPDNTASSYYYCEYAKKEIYDIKQQRLCLAQDEYNHLNNALSTLGASRTSLCSSSSSLSTKYDPDLLKSDVALARSRVSRLKRELEQIRAEMNCTQRGVDTLTSVEQKLSGHHSGCYNITEAQAIMTELRNIQKSLSSGEKEKAELMQSLAQLKDELTRLQFCEGSPEASTLSLPQEKLSTASQTDLSGELVPIGTRLAEMARMRLQYDEARKRIQHIQQQLADLEEKVMPGQTESDKDKLLLFQEKEQLLRELRSITPRTRTQQDMKRIQCEIRRLEQDLNNAFELSNKTITDRVRLHEEKQLLLQQLRDALRSMAMLEGQLKTLSASTLSVSSSSSLGSLSTTSSKGSLSSGLSFTDIYGGPQCLGTSGSQQERPVDMVDLHRRVERLLRGSEQQNNLIGTPSPGRSQPSLSPRSSLSSVSPPVSPLYENAPIGPPPTYEQVELQRRQHQKVTPTATTSSAAPHLDGSQLEDRLTELRLSQQQQQQGVVPQEQASCSSNNSQERLRLVVGPHPPVELQSNNMSQGSGLGRPGIQLPASLPQQEPPPLSPISETPPPTGIRSRASSSGTNTRSVSAAVSDESVAGDSGVFEASNRKRLSGLISDVDLLASGEMSLETAQVQIKLRYSVSDGLLHVGIERARNLAALFIPNNAEVYIKAALLPMQLPVNHMCCTKAVVDLRKPTFGETFPIAVPLNKLYTKTLQVNVWCTSNESEECLGSAQVSLADFSPESPSVKWYNILSFRFMQPSDSPSASTSNNVSANVAVRQAKHDKQESDISVYRNTQNTKEESSDESTIISSQTSTLTRNQGCDELQTAVSLRLEELANCLGSPEEEDEGGGSGSGSGSGGSNNEEDIPEDFMTEDNVLEDVLEHEEDEELNDETRQTEDKETNTECVFIPEQGKQRKLSAAGVAPGAIHDDKNSIVIKRSQTFSPSAAVSKNHYICRLNRSDSDSSMPLYRKGGPFQRNSVERRSLRWRRPSSALSCKTTSKKSSHLPPTARTSLDLELDLQAQHAKLNNLQDELTRLRELKQRLEQAREKGDADLATWLLEDHKFQSLMALAESGKNGKSAEEKKVDKMLKKTSKEIYKLRKTKVAKGKPDIISFKEKMAFFTRVNSNVPVLPPEDFGPDGSVYPTMAQAHMHRRYASEPVTTTTHNSYIGNSTTRPNSVPSGSSASSSASKSGGGGGVTVERNASNVVASATNADEDVSVVSNATSKSVSAKSRSAAAAAAAATTTTMMTTTTMITTTTTTTTESNAQSSENGEDESVIEKNNGNGEPKRYEYVVDRVLGVEV